MVDNFLGNLKTRENEKKIMNKSNMSHKIFNGIATWTNKMMKWRTPDLLGSFLATKLFKIMMQELFLLPNLVQTVEIDDARAHFTTKS